MKLCVEADCDGLLVKEKTEAAAARDLYDDLHCSWQYKAFQDLSSAAWWVLSMPLIHLTEACAATRSWAVIGARGGGCSSYRARAWVIWGK